MAEKELRIKNYELRIGKSDFWNNQAEAVKITKEVEDLKKEVAKWQTLQTEIDGNLDLLAETIKSGDDSLTTELQAQYELLARRAADLEFLTLFNGPYDESNAIISFHAGTGGVDAQDWAEKLERMYLRLAEKMGWQTEMIDRSEGQEAGLKSSLWRVAGHWAYGYLRSESGVHRLVRISPFDAEAMRQTSFALVEVIPELPATADIEIREEDLEYNFSRSSGPGGQNVNKTNTAVKLTHKPSGITVACQTERSQHQNRERALLILKSKLWQERLATEQAELKNIKGEHRQAEWGRQIRSYVLDPYKLVKDHRTNYETSAVEAVLEGEVEPFIAAYLKHKLTQT